jgi:hypothetical protein
VADRISSIGENLEQIIQLNHQQTQHSIRTIQAQIDQLFSGKVTLTARLAGLDGQDQRLAIPTHATIQDSINILSESPAPEAAPNPVQNPVVEMSQAGNLPLDPSIYQMSRTIQTVRELWDEWYSGLDGNPSIQSLEATYGCRWRPGNKERVFFSRRKVIINEIHSRASSGMSLSAAVEEVELVRRKAQCTLYQLQALFKKNV